MGKKLRCDVTVNQSWIDRLTILDFFSFLDGIYRSFKNILFISGWWFIKGGLKLEYPEKNHPTFHKQNLSFSLVTQAGLKLTAVRDLMIKSQRS